MNKYLRYIIQNRMDIVVIIIFVVIFVAIVQVANFIMKNIKSAQGTTSNASSNVAITEQTTLSSAIGDKSENLEAKKNAKDVIVKFIDYCNNHQTEKAYELLTESCKKIVFNNDINLFSQNYYTPRFDSSKNYKIQNWTNNIFKVSLSEDLLSTGGKSNTEIQDFINVSEEQDGTNKINIGGFIAEETINKETTIENIKIIILKRYIFFDFEKYLVKVTNDSGNDILLDDLQNTNTIYLLDSKDVKHNYAQENLTVEQLNVKNRASTQFEIKFTNPYISGRSIKTMVFSKAKTITNGEKEIELKANF